MTGNIPFTWWEIQASSQTLSIAALPLASQQRRWSRATNPRLVTPYSMGHWLPNCLIFFPFFFPDLTSLLWNVFVKIFSSSPTNNREFNSMQWSDLMWPTVYWPNCLSSLFKIDSFPYSPLNVLFREGMCRIFHVACNTKLLLTDPIKSRMATLVHKTLTSRALKPRFATVTNHYPKVVEGEQLFSFRKKENITPTNFLLCELLCTLRRSPVQCEETFGYRSDLIAHMVFKICMEETLYGLTNSI